MSAVQRAKDAIDEKLEPKLADNGGFIARQAVKSRAQREYHLGLTPKHLELPEEPEMERIPLAIHPRNIPTDLQIPTGIELTEAYVKFVIQCVLPFVQHASYVETLSTDNLNRLRDAIKILINTDIASSARIDQQPTARDLYNHAHQSYALGYQRAINELFCEEGICVRSILDQEVNIARRNLSPGSLWTS